MRRDNNWIVIECYRSQLRKFQKLGIGSKTEFKTIITQRLIDITLKRLNELQTPKFQQIRPLEKL